MTKKYNTQISKVKNRKKAMNFFGKNYLFFGEKNYLFG
jgi:hypothetical protein